MAVDSLYVCCMTIPSLEKMRQGGDISGISGGVEKKTAK